MEGKDTGAKARWLICHSSSLLRPLGVQRPGVAKKRSKNDSLVVWLRGAGGAGWAVSGGRDGRRRRMAHLRRQPVLEEREAFVLVNVVAVSPCLMKAGSPDLPLLEKVDELGHLGAVEPTKALR